MGAGMSALVLEEFSVTLRGEANPLVRLDCRIEAGECLALMGPSGRGKSTILLAIAGFAPEWASVSGRIVIGTERIDLLPPERRRLGFLFQEDLLFPHLTVAGNLLFALGPDLVGRRARRSAVEEALATAGLAGLADRAPATLSGGQRSRVALLRTLLARPRALLLDEPFSKLDRRTKAQIRELVFTEARRRALPMVLVTHDPADAEAAGASIVELSED